MDAWKLEGVERGATIINWSGLVKANVTVMIRISGRAMIKVPCAYIFNRVYA